ncbi:prokineticin receptor 2-like [Branchiostoma lanceolatum]|uniref:prokineticin receptor 2-like n=1 Tax=Branchiostoma lanceolatum TaxID=7740 RepID=UPI003454F9B0
MGFANATVYLNEENAHFANNSSLENLLLAFDLDELMKAFLELISDNETEADATRNLFGNASPGGPTNSLDGSEIAIGVLYSLIMLVCGVGNFLLLLALLLYKETRTPTNLLIGNLALSDLLVSLLCLPYNMDYHVVHEGSWHHSTALCAVVNFFTSVSHYVSTHALLAIGIDRYLVVQDARTRRFNPRWTSVVIWVVALVLALPGAIFSRTVPYQREDSVFCGVLWPVSLQHVYKGFHIFLVVCEFAVPAVIMSVFYSFVVCKHPENKDGGLQEKNTLGRLLPLKTLSSAPKHSMGFTDAIIIIIIIIITAITIVIIITIIIIITTFPN